MDIWKWKWVNEWERNDKWKRERINIWKNEQKGGWTREREREWKVELIKDRERVNE